MQTTTSNSSRLSLFDADRVGVTASILCAIHCGVSPVLLIFMPAFGRIWAHPASHALVALLIVPLAAFTIRKGYLIHRKRWVAATAVIGICLVVGGAILPVFSKTHSASTQDVTSFSLTESPALIENTNCESECNSCASEEQDLSASQTSSDGETGCVDACCPSLQLTETGEMSLHIPPAAIVTTLGGIFLIAAHVGNLCGCGHFCREKACCNAA